MELQIITSFQFCILLVWSANCEAPFQGKFQSTDGIVRRHPTVRCELKGNCSGKKIIFFIPSIDRVCGSDAQEKKSDFLHGSVRKYKTLRSSTNCGCGHLMTHFVGIAITTVHSGSISDSGACSRGSCCSTTSCLDLRVIRAI